MDGWARTVTVAVTQRYLLMSSWRFGTALVAKVLRMPYHSLATRAQKRDQLNDSRSAGILGAELVMGGGPDSLKESGGSDAITGGPVSESLPVDSLESSERREMSHLLMTANLKRAQVKQAQTRDKPLEVGDDIPVLNPVGQSKQKVALALLAYNALNLMRSLKSNRHLIKTYMYRETVRYSYCTQAGLLAI